MVTIYEHMTHNKMLKDVRCLSTDEKPLNNIPNGSTCIEIDTGTGFLYNTDGNEWVELPSGGSVIINPATGVEF